MLNGKGDSHFPFPCNEKGMWFYAIKANCTPTQHLKG